MNNIEYIADFVKKAAVAAWQRSEGKNPEGGLNAKGRASYKRETGGTLKAPVTESNPSGERAKRQNSFCSRMCGMKRENTGSKAQSDPDSRINKSLRKWNCKCGEDHSSLYEKVACLVKEAKGRCWEGYEPVPGKEPYSEDSCRPKGEKKKEVKKEAADSDRDNTPNQHMLRDTLAATAGLGLGIGGAYALPGKKSKNRDLITISAGHLKPPYFISDTGAGHTSPAESMYEELLKQPEIKNKKLRAQLLLHKIDGDTPTVVHKSTFGAKRPVHDINGVIVDSGFGITDKNSSNLNKKFKINSKNLIQAAADPYSPSVKGGYVAKPQKTKTKEGWLDYLIGKAYDKVVKQKGKRISYGSKPKNIAGFHSKDISPYIADEVIDKGLSGVRANKAETMAKLIELAKKNGDSGTAAILEDALSKNKKIITVSGSSRGDYVGGRVRELAKELRRQGLSDSHAVIALMGSGKKELMQKLIENKGAASFDRMDRNLFTAAQDMADAHWGSTGAASFSEMRLSPSPVGGFLSKSNTVKDKELDLLKRYARRYKLNIDDLVKARGQVDLDNWNAANKELLTKVHPDHGLSAIQTPKELLEKLKSSTPADAEMAASRAYKNAVKAKKVKGDLAKWLVQQAKGDISRQKAIRNIRTGIGAAGIGGGALIGAGALAHLLRNRKEKASRKNEL